MPTTLREINMQDFEELEARASLDDHMLILPTHVCEKDGEMVGYLSIGAVPTVNVWLDSQRVKAKDTVLFFKQLEGVLDDHHIDKYFMPCASNSPLFPFMRHLGFSHLLATNLFIRKRS